MILHLTRDSVAAGDDVGTSLQIEVSNLLSVSELLQLVIAQRFLATIAGGRATWSVIATQPIALVAQQWPEPRLLPGVTPASLTLTDGMLHLYFRYHRQLDPEVVYAQLVSG